MFQKYKNNWLLLSFLSWPETSVSDRHSEINMNIKTNDMFILLKKNILSKDQMFSKPYIDSGIDYLSVMLRFARRFYKTIGATDKLSCTFFHYFSCFVYWYHSVIFLYEIFHSYSVINIGSQTLRVLGLNVKVSLQSVLSKCWKEIHIKTN